MPSILMSPHVGGQSTHVGGQSTHTGTVMCTMEMCVLGMEVVVGIVHVLTCKSNMYMSSAFPVDTHNQDILLPWQPSFSFCYFEEALGVAKQKCSVKVYNFGGD